MSAPRRTNGSWPRPYFDDMAELFDEFTAVWDRIDRGAFAGWLAGQLTTGARAADLGCGAGRHLPLLAGRYREVLAVDVSERILRLARERHALPAVTYRHAGVLDVYPAADGTFDAVVSVNALHHAGPPEVVLPHVRSLVAPGGRLVVVDMVDPGGWDRPEWHVDRAFGDARVSYELSGDPGKAVTVLRQLLDPAWLAMATHDVPLRRPEFHRLYGEVFPGAVITDELHPLMAGATWTAPA
jgi:SAM-dependent methyltransferase